MLQEHYAAFLDMLRFQITTQANFNRLTNVDPDTLTDMQRAARFLYLQRNAFGGRPTGRHFGVSVRNSGTFNITTLQSDLEALHERLSAVTVVCVNYDAFISRIDRVDMLFYLDPPYWSCENDYGKNLFECADFQKLADQLAGIKGRFLMSINDVPDIREIFAAFEIADVTTRYTISAQKNDRKSTRRELLIGNFDFKGEK